MSSSPVPIQTAPTSEDLATHPLQVLIVDDEALIRWSLRRGLARRGHQVSEAGDGAQGLQLLASEPGRFDVVVLDYRLPDRQDLSLLRDVRRFDPQAVVFMMTAYGDAAMRDQAVSLGVTKVVDKPFQIPAFVSLIESAVSS
jgi:DNA-binding NtrC family response regulator